MYSALQDTTSRDSATTECESLVSCALGSIETIRRNQNEQGLWSKGARLYDRSCVAQGLGPTSTPTG